MPIMEYYSKISKKYNLPAFADFNKEFEIDNIHHGFLAKRIADKMVDKTDRYRKMLERFLHPNVDSIQELTELKVIDRDCREQIMCLYVELVLIERNFNICDLENDEKKFINFIKETLNTWKSIKPTLIKIMNEARSAWKNEECFKKELGEIGYLG